MTRTTAAASVSRGNWGWWLVLALPAVLILYPTASLLIGSFSDAPPGQVGHLTVQNYVEVLTNPALLAIVAKTFGVAIGATLFSVLSGTFLAWLVVRTDVPMRRGIELFALAPFLIPASIAAIGWATLANPDIGVVNTIWRSLTGSEETIVNAYSYAGVAFVLGQHSAGFVFLMMIGPLKNADPGFEDAARLSGASGWTVFRTVQLPLMLPALLPLTLLAFVRAMESFEVPAILGTPAGVFVITNEIYYKLKVSSPPAYGVAIALSVIITFGMVALLMGQSWMSARRTHITLSGKGFRPRRLVLGRWKWLCLLLAALYALLTSVLPLGVILYSSFFRFFGIYDSAMLTLANYRVLFEDEAVQRAIGNTALLVVICASLCMVIGSAVAYATQRRLHAGRTLAEGLILIPWAMPGLVFGTAMLWAYIGIPGFYGTLLVLGVAYVTLGLPISVRSMSAVLGQMSRDLEDCSQVHGASLAQTLRYVVVPLLRPGLIAGWFVLAAIFSRELAASVMLYGYGHEVVSVLLLGFWEQGKGNVVAVLSVVLMAALLILFALERWLADPRVVIGR